MFSSLIADDSHFMLGFVDAYDQSDWSNDIALAHSKGIDGFVSLLQALAS